MALMHDGWTATCMSFMPRSASSARTASGAAAPNRPSGSSSNVTIEELDLPQAELGDASGGHEGELVQRQRPGRAGGGTEGNVLDLPCSSASSRACKRPV